MFGSDLSPEAADSFLESKNHSASGNINLLSFRSFAVFRRRVLCIEMGPSAGVAYELADRRLKPVLTRSSVA